MTKPRERSFDVLKDKDREYWEYLKKYGFSIFGDEKLNRQAICQLLDEYGIDDREPGQFWGTQKSIWLRDRQYTKVASDLKTRSNEIDRLSKSLRKSQNLLKSLPWEDIHSLSVVPKQHEDFFLSNFPEVKAEFDFSAFSEEFGPFRDGFPISTLFRRHPLSVNIDVFIKILEALAVGAETHSAHLKEKDSPERSAIIHHQDARPEKLVADNFLKYYSRQTRKDFVVNCSGERIKATPESISFTQAGFSALGIEEVKSTTISATCNACAREEHTRRKANIAD